MAIFAFTFYAFFALSKTSAQNVEQVPEELSSLRAQSTHTEITVTWTLADTLQNGVRGYIVGWGRGIPDEHTQVVASNQTSFVIKDIVPGGEYVISAKAFNDVGDGRPIYETIRAKFYVPEVVSSLRAQSSDTEITVSWSPANTLQNEVLGYIVEWKLMPDIPTDQSTFWHTQMLGSNQTSFVIKDIVPGGKYQIKVEAFNDFGNSGPNYEFIRIKSDEKNPKPYFENARLDRFVWARPGSTAQLKCTVRNLGDRKVTWIQMDKPLPPLYQYNESCYQVLSTDTAVFTTDSRVEVSHIEGADDWTLSISNVTRTNDQGEYKCSVNTDPKMVLPFTLDIF